METLNQEITNVLKSGGASLVGFADLSELDIDSRDSFPFGISIAVALDARVISGITQGPTMRYYDEYQKVNILLNNLYQSAKLFLASTGYRVNALTTGSYIPDTLSAKLPNKTVATRAGLGWIGKCALLITRQYGSAVRLTKILTDAPLSCGKPINESFCGGCLECVKICPDAVSGRNWQAGVSRESFFDAYKCKEKMRELSLNKFGEKIWLCGRCIVACPWTKKYIEMN